MGCAGGLPLPHPYDVSLPYHDEYSQKDVGAAGHAGSNFCSRLTASAQSNAAQHRTAAWLTGVAALLAAGAGTAVVATGEPDDSGAKNRYKVAAVTLPLGAALFAYLSGGQFAMADASYSAAGAAASAASLRDDEAANTTCNAAIAAWETDGVSSSAPFAAAVGKLTEAKQAEDKAQSDQAAADATQKAADEAIKKAAKDQAAADQTAAEGGAPNKKLEAPK
jgi:hypothetical protein